ncbi:hypothetical protein P154DRAFT_424541, partial [Amniculicola lignicola CBS 123094]
MAPYSYERLDPSSSSIRILTLLPGKSYENIRCELREERLDSNPKYEALSYVWGNPANSRVVMLHRCIHRVTSNLESALRHLRLPDRNRYLWIDAL